MKAPTTRRLKISPEVREAFYERKAVVALESTVITHGLPYPDNLSTARDLEAAVRAEGAVPATIAVLDGVVCVGLDAGQLEHLAQLEDPLKISRADFAFALSQKKSGGTTVAGTMLVAEENRIRVFATGGIGGVHRGVAGHWDISADLEELGRTSVCVVSAGAKAVLDLPKTLEVLETKGVPVVGYQTDKFPAFYYRDSGLALTQSCDTTDDIADLLTHKWNLSRWPDQMRFPGGVLIANPVREEHEVPREEIEQAITTALDDMEKQGISGKQVTPFMLAAVSRLTEGRSKAANMVLLRNNASLAARIAVALEKRVLR